MSIERLERQGGVVWRVRWREGGHNRAKVLGRKRDAEALTPRCAVASEQAGWSNRRRRR